ncbi:MAG: GTP-sensing pleiotropic transcriptional regulator CodY [Tissierellales bacterium]|jgi:transcriptional pleiotropic repressor|nr:GTP-sensing pleiotropic transcriptional regulator CodY [Tissierellales bacterium]
MSESLLTKTRRLNKILQDSGNNPVSFEDLSRTLGEILGSEVYITSRRGKILGASVDQEQLIVAVTDDDMRLDAEYNEKLLKIKETKENLSSENAPELLALCNDECATMTIIPIHSAKDRLGTLVLNRKDKKFTEDDLVLCEYSATIVGMEIIRAKNDELEEEVRKKAIVQIAIGTLSYSELEAIEHILKELEGEEGLLVASKIADRVGITRSVIVNALRKFESAGVIESRSLGMKGTYIRILNEYLLAELNIVK